MKKLSVFLAALLALTLLAGCGGGASSQAEGYGSSADYAAVIEAARPSELNEAGFYTVVTGPDDPHHDLIFYETSPFNEGDMLRYAISSPGIITLAYGVAIILPQPGKEQAVLDAVNEFVTQNQKAQENYLRPQYEIALAAQVKVAKSGEVLLAMCEDAEAVMASMEKDLAAAPLAPVSTGSGQ